MTARGASTSDSSLVVLVIDGNAETNAALVRSLAERYRVAATLDANVGFEKALVLGPNLIVTNLDMSVSRDGVSQNLVSMLRKRDELASTPIVLIASKSDPRLRASLLRKDAQDCLTQPFSTEELRVRIENVLAVKAARDAQLLSEERFRALFEHAPDCVFIADLDDGTCTGANARACQLLGYTHEELVGKPIHELIPEDDIPRFITVKDALLHGEIERGEWQLRHKGGALFPVEVSAKILPDGRCQAFVRDITERRRNEEALRLSEAKFSEIFAISADAIVTIDDTQRITMFNEGAETIFGYTKTEIIGQPLGILIPDQFREKHRHHVERFAHGQENSRRMGARRAEILGRRKNGEHFSADAAISKFEIGGKRVLSVSLRDVSEQKRTEREQRLLAETGKLLVTAGSDYERLVTDMTNVIVHDIADWCAIDILQNDDVRRLRAAHADPAKARFCEAIERHALGRERSNLVADVFATQRPKLVQDATPAYLESIAQNQEHLRIMRAIDMTSFIVVPLVARGQSLGTLAFGASSGSRRYGPRDVSLAEQLASLFALAVDNARLHEAVERAVRARDEVLGIVAHDLRNPLNTIVLQSVALRRRGPDPERREQSAPERIHRAAMRMNRLIQDLLDVTRLEAGQRLALTPETVGVASVVAESVEQLRTAVAASDRQISVELEPGLPELCADRARVLQVFDNLLSNALKFSRRKVTLGARRGDGEVVFSIADDGIGVSAEDLPRLFDRFWQATRADRRGAGLGLSIVKGIVEGHGGRVWVKSNDNVGTTFYFTLPTAAPARM